MRKGASDDSVGLPVGQEACAPALCNIRAGAHHSPSINKSSATPFPKVREKRREGRAGEGAWNRKRNRHTCSRTHGKLLDEPGAIVTVVAMEDADKSTRAPVKSSPSQPDAAGQQDATC